MGEPTNRTLTVGDAAEVLARLPEGSVHLVYLDPPYYTQRDWGEFSDRWRDVGEFIEAMRRIAVQVCRVLVPGGACYWQGDENAIHRVWLMLEEVFGVPIRRHIIWQGSSPSGVKSTAPNWVRGHDSILYFIRQGPGKRWNRQWDPDTAEKVSRARRVDADGRRYEQQHTPGHPRRYLDESRGSPAGSVWGPRTFHREYEPHSERRNRYYTRTDADGRRYQPMPDGKRCYEDENLGRAVGSVWAVGKPRVWNRQLEPHSETRERRYYLTEEGTGRKYAIMNGRKTYADENPGRPAGTVWGIPHVFRPLYEEYSPERMACFNHTDEDGRRYQLRHDKHEAEPYRQYADQYDGTRIGSVWRDFFAPNSGERVGYPTQKPTELTDRIIAASTDPGDLVCDPCCGSGTTLVSAERAGRRWIGIDRNPEAIRVAAERVGAEVSGLALIDEGPPVRVVGADTDT